MEHEEWMSEAAAGADHTNPADEPQPESGLSQADVELIVTTTLAELPAEFATKLADPRANLEIVVAPRASWRQRQAVRLRPYEDLYGLYEGVPIPARNSSYSLVGPDVITIFSQPLLRDFPSAAALAAQVRRTVLHELAHHFGISDARLIELGAY